MLGVEGKNFLNSVVRETVLIQCVWASLKSDIIYSSIIQVSYTSVSTFRILKLISITNKDESKKRKLTLLWYIFLLHKRGGY